MLKVTVGLQVTTGTTVVPQKYFILTLNLTLFLEQKKKNMRGD